MNGKFILYAVLVSILCTTASWGRMQPGPSSNGSRSGAGGSSWSSNTGGGSWSGGSSGGGHK